MKKELIIRVSKVLGFSGNFGFVFSSNKTNTVTKLYFNGDSILSTKNDLELIGKKISERISTLIFYTEDPEKKYLPYKCVFSDKLISTSAIARSNSERIHEMILPITQDEAIFVFNNLP